MSSQSPNLFTLARSKLHLSVGGKDSCSLHRWVLLKNSIIRSNPLTTSSAAAEEADVNHVYPPSHGDEYDEEVSTEEEADSFLFPDAGKFVDNRATNVNASEAEWLDSLLETLGDDDEEELSVSDVHVSLSPTDDDEDLLPSPLLSPSSSSDDLVSPTAYYPSPIAVPYPVPYPPFHPPLIHSYGFDSSFDSPITSMPLSHDDPLPYYDLDDMSDMSVPDAIEDTSDDESEVPTTPSLTRSTSSSLSSVDPASIPLPVGRSRSPHLHPHVYIDTDDAYFYPFELDPLPSTDFHGSYNAYQEC